MSVNKAILLGNLGADPEIHVSKNKKYICTFTIATNAPNHNKPTEWHQIVCFGSLAENCSKYLRRGKKVFVEGQIQTSQWKDSEGIERTSNQILAKNIQFVGSRTTELPDTSPEDDYHLPTSEDYHIDENEEEFSY